MNIDLIEVGARLWVETHDGNINSWYDEVLIESIDNENDVVWFSKEARCGWSRSKYVLAKCPDGEDRETKQMKHRRECIAICLTDEPHSAYALAMHPAQFDAGLIRDVAASLGCGNYNKMTYSRALEFCAENAKNQHGETK